MSELFTETGINQEVLQTELGDLYYNDPETRQQPTKMFDNIKDRAGLLKFAATAQRELNTTKNKHEEALKGMVRIPQDGDDDNVIQAFREARGSAKKVEDYELAIPEGDDKQGFEAIANLVKGAALEVGLTKAELGAVWQRAAEGIVGMLKQIDEAGLKVQQEEEKTLKETKKDGYGSFMAESEKVLKKVGDKLIATLKNYGLYNNPEIRELCFTCAPYINQTPGAGGTGGGGEEEVEGLGLKYEYDDTGKPIS